QEQLEWEAAHGAKISMGFRGTLNAGGSRVEAAPPASAPAGGQNAAAAAPAAPAAPVAPTAATPSAAPPADAPPPENADEADVVIAGLVGAGGGGLTAMVLAARENDLESVKHLVDAGADLNQVTEYGWTPLLTATNNRHYKLGTFLLEHGADPNIANK